MPRVDPLQGLNYEPAALVVLNISTNFADLFGSAVAIEIVVLHLKVLSHHAQDLTGLLVQLRVSDSGDDHPESHRGVETGDRKGSKETLHLERDIVST